MRYFVLRYLYLVCWFFVVAAVCTHGNFMTIDRHARERVKLNTRRSRFRCVVPEFAPVAGLKEESFKSKIETNRAVGNGSISAFNRFRPPFVRVHVMVWGGQLSDLGSIFSMYTCFLFCATRRRPSFRTLLVGLLSSKHAASFTYQLKTLNSEFPSTNLHK